MSKRIVGVLFQKNGYGGYFDVAVFMGPEYPTEDEAHDALFYLEKENDPWATEIGQKAIAGMIEMEKLGDDEVEAAKSGHALSFHVLWE